VTGEAHSVERCCHGSQDLWPPDDTASESYDRIEGIYPVAGTDVLGGAVGVNSPKEQFGDAGP